MRKTGAHGQLRSAGAERWARLGPGIKAIDDPYLLTLAPDSAWRVFRVYFAIQDLWLPAELVAQIILNALGGYRHPRLFVEACFNELPRELTLEHARLIAQVVLILHRAGVKCCGPSWATGSYELEDWQRMRDYVVVEDGQVKRWCGLDAISVHAYWATEGLTRWNALRWHDYWRPGDPPILVTECGRDRVRDGAGGVYVGQGGWIKDGIAAEAFELELCRWDEELCRYPEVLCSYVFTAAPEATWWGFNIDGLNLERLLGGGADQPAPIVVPEGSVVMDEFLAWAYDVWRRSRELRNDKRIGLNPDGAIGKFWLEQAKQGKYLGAPEGPEHPVYGGKYLVQEFAGAVVHFHVATGRVGVGFPLS